MKSTESTPFPIPVVMYLWESGDNIKISEVNHYYDAIQQLSIGTIFNAFAVNISKTSRNS